MIILNRKSLNILALKQDFEIDNYKLINYLNIEINDSLSILSMRNHPFIKKQMNNFKIISKKEHFKFIENLKSENAGYWILKNKNKIIGSISLTNINFDKSSCVGGNFIDPKHIGTGLGLVINYFMHLLAFEKISCKMINASIKKTNENAMKINIFFGAMKINPSSNNDIFSHVQFLNTTWEKEIKLKTYKLLKYAK